MIHFRLANSNAKKGFVKLTDMYETNQPCPVPNHSIEFTFMDDLSSHIRTYVYAVVVIGDKDNKNV